MLISSINLLRVKTEKVLFSPDGLNKIYASWGCPVQTLSIISCPPWSKETTNEFAWHWGHHGVHSCRDLSWLPSGSQDTPHCNVKSFKSIWAECLKPYSFLLQDTEKKHPQCPALWGLPSTSWLLGITLQWETLPKPRSDGIATVEHGVCTGLCVPSTLGFAKRILALGYHPSVRDTH